MKSANQNSSRYLLPDESKVLYQRLLDTCAAGRLHTARSIARDIIAIVSRAPHSARNTVVANKLMADAYRVCGNYKMAAKHGMRQLALFKEIVFISPPGDPISRGKILGGSKRARLYLEIADDLVRAKRWSLLRRITLEGERLSREFKLPKEARQLALMRQQRRL